MAIPVGTILLPSFLLLLPCLPPTRVCGGRPPPEQTFFGRRGWVHRSVRLSCRWKAEQVSPTFPRGATRRALAPSATYPCCGCRMAAMSAKDFEILRQHMLVEISAGTFHVS